MRLNDLPASWQVIAKAQTTRQGETVTGGKAIRARRGRMNKWEQSFADEVLVPRMKTGELADWKFEAVKVFAGIGSYYCPDFWTIDAKGQVTFYEVKGFRRADGISKLKAAAGFWPCWKFVFVTRGKHGGWSYTDVG